jgi:hypothetical protein
MSVVHVAVPYSACCDGLELSVREELRRVTARLENREE